MNIIDYLEWENISDKEQKRVLYVDQNKEITVGEFLKTAIDIGMTIAEKEVHNSAIAVMAEQSWYTLAFYFGILLSGNYYVAMSPELPEEKKSIILKQAKAAAICSTDSKKESDKLLESITLEKINHYSDIKKCMERLKQCRDRLPDNPILYMIFTSGSTGEPKGIIKSHGAMISFVKNYIEEFSFSNEDVLANQTPFYFDASAKDIYLNWKLKCTLHIFDKKMFIMPIPMMEYFNKHKISVIQWVPSALTILSKLKVFDKIKPQYLKKVFFVGEVFPIQQLKIWMDNLSDTEFINLYGSSEMCGVCAYYKVARLLESLEMLPIGRPMKHVQMKLILNENEIKETNVVGEIYIASDTLAEGYVGVDEEDTFTEHKNIKWYPSGDLASFGEDGLIYFVSRKDFQIKHMGHRIELGEIEQATLKVSGIEQVCCIYEQEKIKMFYTGTIERTELAKELRNRLVSYMVPNKVTHLQKMPLNANGKIDRKKLIDRQFIKSMEIKERRKL